MRQKNGHTVDVLSSEVLVISQVLKANKQMYRKNRNNWTMNCNR